jgi:hypothetical protein
VRHDSKRACISFISLTFTYSLTPLPRTLVRVPQLAVVCQKHVRSQVTPNMTFLEVQLLAGQVFAAGRALASSSRAYSRVVLPNVGPSRHQSKVACSAEMDESYVSGRGETDIVREIP